VRHNCIQFRAKSGLYPWTFVENGRRAEAKVSGSLVTDDGHFMLRAAAEGVGVAYVVETHAAAYLSTGALEPLLQDYAAPFPGFFLYYPSRRHVPAPLRLFAQFMSAQFTNAQSTNAQFTDASAAGTDRTGLGARLSTPAERAMSISEDYVSLTEQ